MSRMTVTGRRVWVTGASAGIGRAVTGGLVRRGATAIASARNERELGELTPECGGDCVVALPFDLTDRSAHQRTADEISQRLGGLDIAFLNAGTCEYVEVETFDSAVFERTMRTNFLSMVYRIKAVLPLLRQSPAPHLVGMSSTVAVAALPRAEAYGASKAAITYLLESLRMDLYRSGITLSVVSPGFVRTPSRIGTISRCLSASRWTKRPAELSTVSRRVSRTVTSLNGSVWRSNCWPSCRVESTRA